MSDKKKSILEEAILDAKRIQEALNSNTKEILRSLAKEEIDSLVKESLEEDYIVEDVEEEDVVDTEEEIDIDDEADDEAEEIDIDAEVEDTEEIEMEDSMEDDDLEGDYDTEMVAMPSDEVEMDMTDASDDEVLQIYKKLTDSDEIEVVVDDNEIELSVKEPGDFLIKMDDSEDMGDEPMDVDDMEPMELVGDMDMEDEDMEDEDMDDEDMDDEIMYEIDLGEMEHEEDVLDECGDEDMENMDPLEEKIQVGKKHTVANTLTDIKGAGGKANKVKSPNVTAPMQESKIIKKYNVLLKEAKQLKNKNEEYKGALRKFRTMLAETVVFNSNLTYVTKLFMDHSTTKQEKETVFKRFDNEVSTLKESKQLYKRIASEFGSRKPINESISKKMNNDVNTGVSKQLTESTAYVDKETSRIIGLMNRVDKR